MTDVSLQTPPRFWFFRRLAALVLREMTSRYGRSAGGYIWAVVEPLGMLALLAAGLSLIVRNPALGSSFILFYATGYLPYFMFQKLAGVVMSGLVYSRHLLRFPAVGWVEALLARACLQTITCLFVACTILGGLLLLLDERLVFVPGPVVMSFFLSALLGLALGVLNCAISGIWTMWSQIWKIMTRPLLLASGIIWIMADMPKAVQDILFYNPLVHITALARTGFYPMYDPNFISTTYVAGVSLIILALGLLLIHRFHGYIIGNI